MPDDDNDGALFEAEEVDKGDQFMAIKVEWIHFYYLYQ